MRFVLNVVMQNEGDFVEVNLLYTHESIWESGGTIELIFFTSALKG